MRKKPDADDLIHCACGCGQFIKKYGSDRRLRRFAKNHTHRGRKRSQETKDKIGKANKGKRPCNVIIQNLVNYSKTHTGENATNWRGDKVGYHQLHHWIRNKLPKPDNGLCMLCKETPFREVACITSIYNRELRNWAWFCRKCHMKWDNINPRTITNLKQYQ